MFFSTHISILSGILCWQNNYGTMFPPSHTLYGLANTHMEANLLPKRRILIWICGGVLTYLFIYPWYIMIEIGLWLEVLGLVTPVLWETTNLSCSLPKSMFVHTIKPIYCLPVNPGSLWGMKPGKAPHPPCASQLPSKPVVCISYITRCPLKICQNFVLHSPNHHHVILHSVPLSSHLKSFLLATPKLACLS